MNIRLTRPSPIPSLVIQPYRLLPSAYEEQNWMVFYFRIGFVEAEYDFFDWTTENELRQSILFVSSPSDIIICKLEAKFSLWCISNVFPFVGVATIPSLRRIVRADNCVPFESVNSDGYIWFDLLCRFLIGADLHAQLKVVFDLGREHLSKVHRLSISSSHCQHSIEKRRPF